MLKNLFLLQAQQSRVVREATFKDMLGAVGLATDIEQPENLKWARDDNQQE